MVNAKTNKGINDHLLFQSAIEISQQTAGVTQSKCIHFKRFRQNIV